VNKGHDAKDFILASFGGAGGLHVCALADAMAMKNALVPVHGGVLSALGMVVADQGRQFSKTLSLDVQPIDEKSLEDQFAQLEQGGMEQLALEGLHSSMLVSKRSADLRYKGQSYTLNIDWHALAGVLEAFEQLHEQRYGYRHDAPIELLTIRVNLSTEKTPFALPQLITQAHCNNIRHCKVYGETKQARLLARAELYPGELIEGPAVITEYSATTFVAANWSAAVDGFGNLVLQKQS
jgi:N-methylhydantoinase A